MLSAKKSPFVIITHGKSAAVLLDVVEYEVLLEKSGVLQDIHTEERQLEEGNGFGHDEEKGRILERRRREGTPE